MVNNSTEVVAVAGNKVEFCGEVFTLSGFCKEFMPDDKRTKSNSYRGCNFFFLDGVCLGKIFREVMEAAPEYVPTIDEGEDATFEPQRADGIQETGHIRHEANNFEHKECEEKPHKGQTGHSDGKITLHPTVSHLLRENAIRAVFGRYLDMWGRWRPPRPVVCVQRYCAVVLPHLWLAGLGHHHITRITRGG